MTPRPDFGRHKTLSPLLSGAGGGLETRSGKIRCTILARSPDPRPPNFPLNLRIPDALIRRKRLGLQRTQELSSLRDLASGAERNGQVHTAGKHLVPPRGGFGGGSLNDHVGRIGAQSQADRSHQTAPPTLGPAPCPQPSSAQTDSCHAASEWSVTYLECSIRKKVNNKTNQAKPSLFLLVLHQATIGGKQRGCVILSIISLSAEQH